jgi:hypothetical protein
MEQAGEGRVITNARGLKKKLRGNVFNLSERGYRKTNIQKSKEF